MNDIERKIAEDICTLNRWDTPVKLRGRLGRDLTGDEVSVAMAVLQVYVPHEEWVQVWQEQHGFRKPAEVPQQEHKDEA